MRDVTIGDAEHARQQAIESLVARLDGLLTAEEAATGLVRHGAAAIQPLRRFLLEGRPSSIFQPRRWAVLALGALGAHDVLLDFLRNRKPVDDEQARFGEEVVEGAAARQLAESGGEDVVRTLLEIARARNVPGVLEALVRLRPPDAVPLFVNALEDDYSRPWAEQALLDFAEIAGPQLIEAATRRVPDEEDESRSSLSRRRAALRILTVTGLAGADWARLRPLLSDRDTEVRVTAARLALVAGSHADRVRAAAVLLAAVRDAPWSLADDIEDALLGFFGNRLLDLDQRLRRAARDPADPAFRLLRRVKRRLEDRRGPGSPPQPVDGR